MRPNWNYIIVLVLALVMLSSCIVSSSLIFGEGDIGTHPNLLSNPSFAGSSFDGVGLPPGWMLMDVARDLPTTISIDPDTVYAGDNSLKIDPSPNAVMIVSDAFRVRRYGGYYLRLRAKSSLPQGETINLHFITFNTNGKTLNRFKSKLRLTDEWKVCSLSAGFIREGASFGRLAIMIPQFAEGSIWIDDAGAWEVHSFRID